MSLQINFRKAGWNSGRHERYVRIAGAMALGASMMTLQACSSTSSAVSGYAPLAADIKPTAATEIEKDIYRSNRLRNSRRDAQTFDYPSIYSGLQDGDISIPSFDYTKMDPKYLRQEVQYFGPEKAGTIIVDARRRHLYLVQPGGMAIRYGIAVGKEGFGWTGNAVLQWKQKWPTWTPPAEMIERKPELKKYAEGLKGSTENPLGARAMYLFKNGKDTMYRIHGTTQPFSIGKAASSGCFRMINQDVIDLYSRVGNKALVEVRPEIQASLVKDINSTR